MQKTQQKAVLAKSAWLQAKLANFHFVLHKLFKSVW